VTSIAVAPLSMTLSSNGTQPFAATAVDQFGDVLATEPTFSWSVLGAGTIDNNGNYAPPYAAGSATVVAQCGSVTGTYDVTFPGSAQWNSASSGSWGSGADWTVSGDTVSAPGLRAVAGDTVVFDSSSPATVTLDGANPSVAGVVFKSSAIDQIAQGTGGTLQFDNGSNSATITVVTGNDAISAPVVLASNLIVSPAVGSQLTISGEIGGAGQSLSVDDRGTVVLSGLNSYTGGTTVSAGTLVLANSSAIAANTSLTVGAGGILIFDPSVGATPSQVATAATLALANSTATTATSANASAATAGVGDRIASDAAKLAASAVLQLSQSVPAGTLGPSTEDGLVWSSMPHTLFQKPSETLQNKRRGHVLEINSTKVAGDLAWLGQAANGLDSSDRHHKVLVIQALDAMFAQYGR
ncbi:MAG: autotransporter-associated beta strand repeat-containing protein, partial [Thermoguttaceae bacterium]